jgi:hypothetical protein
VDADHDEKGEGYMESQPEENPKAGCHTVSFVDFLQIWQSTLLPVKPQVDACY